MSHNSKYLEIIDEYDKTLHKLLLETEQFSEGEVLTASSGLRDVYVGKGADAFFSRFEMIRTRLVDNEEGIHRLRGKLKILQEVIGTKSMSGQE